MSARMILTAIALSLFTISGGNAASTENVKCKKPNGDGYTIEGILYNVPSSETVKQLQLDCAKKFSACESSDQHPICLPAVISKSVQNEKPKARK